MKICIVLFGLIATSVVSAQDVLSVSIQTELDIIFTSTQTQITTVADILVVAIQTAGKLEYLIKLPNYLIIKLVQLYK